MSLHNFSCQYCGDADEELHVHHKGYNKINGEYIDPWLYSSCAFSCLCSTCHSLTHMAKSKIEKFVIGQLNFDLKQAQQRHQDAMNFHLAEYTRSMNEWKQKYKDIEHTP